MAEVLYILPGERGGVPYPTQTPVEKKIGDFLRSLRIPGGVAVPAPGQTPEATRKAEDAIKAAKQANAQADAQRQAPTGPSFCLGYDRKLCEGAKLGPWDASGACRAVANLTCLTVGLAVLLALLGLSLNALLRS